MFENSTLIFFESMIRYNIIIFHFVLYNIFLSGFWHLYFPQILSLNYRA